MKIDYDKPSDSLYVKLNDRPSTESEEIRNGFVLDFDATGAVVGIDIEHASQVVDLRTFDVPHTA